MLECYCAQIEDGVVTQVIVCECVEWASLRLGGHWVCTGDRLVCVGGLLIDGEIVPPPEPPSPVN